MVHRDEQRPPGPLLQGGGEPQQLRQRRVVALPAWMAPPFAPPSVAQSNNVGGANRLSHYRGGDQVPYWFSPSVPCAPPPPQTLRQTSEKEGVQLRGGKFGKCCWQKPPFSVRGQLDLGRTLDWTEWNFKFEKKTQIMRLLWGFLGMRSIMNLKEKYP